MEWTFDAGAGISSTPLVDGELVYIGSEDGRLLALDTQDGRLAWQFQTGDMVRGVPAIWDEIVFIGSDDGNLYGLDKATGAPVWRYRLGGAITAGPAGGRRPSLRRLHDAAPLRIRSGDEARGALMSAAAEPKHRYGKLNLWLLAAGLALAAAHTVVVAA